jgi:hypothetical protein
MFDTINQFLYCQTIVDIADFETNKQLSTGLFCITYFLKRANKLDQLCKGFLILITFENTLFC